MSVKVDIISGFLGAGKTTLIRKLLETKFNGEKIVLIENEFGEIGIDGSFLKEAGVNIKEMNSGCICCSLVGDFSKSMQEVIDKFAPERIIIEPSGVGKLSDIVVAVQKLKLDLKLNIIATVVDGTKCKIYIKNFGEFFNNQVEDANTIIVSKTENLSEEKKNEVYDLLREKNDHANIIFVSVPKAEAHKLLETLEKQGSITEELMAKVKEEACCHHHHDDDENDHDHNHECCYHHHHDDDEDEDENHDHDHECCCHHHDEDENDQDHDHECCHHHDEDDDDHDDDHEHHHHHHGHDADEVFVSYGYETTNAYSYEELKNILEAFKDEEKYGVVLRAKGILKASDQNDWYYFDYVAGDYQINSGSEDYMGRFVVIGSKLQKENLDDKILKK